MKISINQEEIKKFLNNLGETELVKLEVSDEIQIKTSENLEKLNGSIMEQGSAVVLAKQLLLAVNSFDDNEVTIYVNSIDNILTVTNQQVMTSIRLQPETISFATKKKAKRRKKINEEII